jgi:hypothetical protein
MERPARRARERRYQRVSRAGRGRAAAGRGCRLTTWAIGHRGFDVLCPRTRSKADENLDQFLVAIDSVHARGRLCNGESERASTRGGGTPRRDGGCVSLGGVDFMARFSAAPLERPQE